MRSCEQAGERHVIFVASTLVVGGAERAVQELVRGLPRLGWSTSVVTLRAAGAIGDELRAAGVPVAEQWAGGGAWAPWTAIAGAARFAQRCAETSPAAVYCLDHQNAVAMALTGAAWTRVPTRLVAFHTMGQSGGRPSIGPVMRQALRAATGVVAVAEGQRRLLREVEHLSAPPVHLVRLGIDLERFGRAGDDAALRVVTRRSLALPQEACVLLCVAQLRPEKGHEVLLEALTLARALASSPSLVLLLAGEGVQRTTLAAHAERLGLGDSVRFLGRRDDVPALLAAADLLVLASHPEVETTPTVAIEAMAARRAVIATRVGAVDEVVQDGVTGILVPAGDAAALAQAITRLAGDPAVRARMAEAGHARACREFARERMIAETAALLEPRMPDIQHRQPNSSTATRHAPAALPRGAERSH